LEGAPDHLRFAAVLTQRLLLGLRLGPLRSPHHILGWKIAERGNDWVRIEATSWMMAASLVFKVDEVGLSWRRSSGTTGGWQFSSGRRYPSSIAKWGSP
jgi:hypothetical protein